MKTKKILHSKLNWIFLSALSGSLVSCVTEPITEYTRPKSAAQNVVSMQAVQYIPPKGTKPEVKKIKTPPPSLSMKLPEPVAIVLPPLSAAEKVAIIGEKNCPKKTAKGKVYCNKIKIGAGARWLPKNLHKNGGLLWHNTPKGRVWRLRITSTDARGLFIWFKKFNVDKGQVWLHSINGNVDGPYTGKGLYGGDDFPSSSIYDDNLVIEYWPPTTSPNQHIVPFQIDSISHIW